MNHSDRLTRVTLEAIVEGSDDAILSESLDGIITSWNAAAGRLFGYGVEEIIGQPITVIIPPDRHQEEASLLDRVRQGESITHYKTVRLAKDGRRVDVLLTVSPLRGSADQVVGASKIIRDITERKRAEAVQGHFRAIFESAPGLYLVLSPENYEIVGASDAYLRATNTERNEIVGKGLFEVFPDDPKDPRADGVRNLRASLERVKTARTRDVMAVQHYPIRRPAAEGGGFEDRWWSPTNSPVLGVNGEVAYIIHRVEDVTAYVTSRPEGAGVAESAQTLEGRVGMEAEIVMRGQELQRANEQLRQSEQRFRAIFENAGLGIAEADSATRFLAVNDRWCQIVRRSREELLRMNVHDLTHPEDWPESDRLNAALIAGPESQISYEKRYVQGNGAIAWVRVTVSAIRAENGEFLRGLALLEDITERKRAEEAIRASDEFNRSLIESSLDCIKTLDLQGNLLSMNASGQKLLEIGDLGRYLGTSWIDLWSEDVRPQVREAVATAREGGTGRFQAFGPTPSGQPKCWDVIITPIRGLDGSIGRLLAVARDITEQKTTEAARQQSEERLRQARDQLSVELAAMNQLHELSTRFVRGDDIHPLLDAILDTAIAITSAQKGQIQLLNVTFGELDVASHRGLDPAFVEFFSHIRPGEAACGTAMQTRQCVVVEDVTLSPVFLTTPRALELMLANGVRGVVCTPLLTRTGQMLGVLSMHHAAPRRPSERDLHLLDMLARQAADFVERLHSEQALQAAREELVQANANLERKVQERTAQLQETVGELEHFSNTLAHDMRAPLRAMQGFAALLVQECDVCLSPARKDYLRRITTASDRMDHLIIDALDYSKAMRNEIPLSPVDADALLRGMLEDYPAFQPPNAEIEITDTIPRVLGNQAALTQCFSNLLGNAVKFVLPGTAPKVRIWAENRCQTVCLWFEDNGIGIAHESQERIFEMFQQVGKGYEGTGIGLALVRKVAQRMGGKVGVESEPGKGSRFWLELKRASPIPLESPQGACIK